MNLGHIGVVHAASPCVFLENPTYTDHAEQVAFRGSQCTHAGCPDDRYASTEGIQNFLVPDRSGILKPSINDADDGRSFFHSLEDVSLDGRAVNDDIPGSLMCIR